MKLHGYLEFIVVVIIVETKINDQSEKTITSDKLTMDPINSIYFIGFSKLFWTL